MPIIDSKYTENLVKTIDAIPDCTTLKAFRDQLINTLQKMLTDAIIRKAKMALLATAPTNLVSAIAWIVNFIDTNIKKPYEEAVQLEAELAALYTTLAAKIASKSDLLHCDLTQ